jgi:Effector protein
MSVNFEEQFLLMLSPYDRNEDAYEEGHPKWGHKKPPEPIKNTEAWTQAVREDIKKISQTKVGSLLLRSIKHHGQVIFIRPRRSTDCNAETGYGEEIHNKGSLHAGTGATISFNPEIYKVGGVCETKHLEMGGIHIQSHETLLHELVHAFRKVSGKLKQIPLGKGLAFYNTNEEFNAVLVQGIYASERRTPVRASHFHHFEIDKKLNGSLKFFQASTEAFQYVEKFCLENPGFTKGFININAPFNPINAYYQDKEVARQFSKSATARGRDKVMPILHVIKNFLRNN